MDIKNQGALKSDAFGKFMKMGQGDTGLTLEAFEETCRDRSGNPSDDCMEELFTQILALVVVLMGAKKQLVSDADIKIVINDDEDNPLIAKAGGNLLSTLAEHKIFVPSACGGMGSCGVCTVHVHEGGGAMLAAAWSGMGLGWR